MAANGKPGDAGKQSVFFEIIVLVVAGAFGSFDERIGVSRVEDARSIDLSLITRNVEPLVDGFIHDLISVNCRMGR